MYEFFSYAYVSAISACVVLIIMLLFTDTVDKNHGRAKIYLFILLGMSILQGVAHILLASPFTTGNIELLHIYPMTSFGLKTMLAYFILLSVMNVLELKKKVIFKAYLLPLSLTLLYGVLYFICEDVSVRNLEGLATLNVMVSIRVLIFLTLMAAFVTSFVVIYKSYLNYLRSIDNFYADSENMKLRKIMYVGLFYFVVGILSLASNFTGSVAFISVFHGMNVVLYIAFVLLLINEQKIVEKVGCEMEIASPASNEECADDEENDSILKKIKEWAESEEKQFLKQGISVQEVAESVKVGKRVLSSFINRHYNMNFNTWINTLRMEEVCKYLHQDYSFTEIAEMTGFTDLSSMSKIFKKMKGMTLTDYRKQYVVTQ